ncbi:putative toxin-antitoxin system toxin component, PIN family [Gemmatimonas aurantiaca]|uniref:putative toxin-antitoxin system toxin component, PIN family n=1 Tax=Gemmatimonas aurantiaca TaxID=173480 RepID=UPI00301E16AD
MRVCLDTNVLVAALATRGLCADVFRLVLAEHDLVIGEVILEEIRRVLATKFKVPADHIESIVAVFDPFPCLPKPTRPGPVGIRDPADRWVFATALAGNAEVLVTGDQDLLTFHEQTSNRILTPRAFWELVRSGAG